MPNWCFTEYIFTGPLKELERLERNITKWTEKNYAPNGFGKDWLGNIAEGAGMDYTKIPCRGTIGNLYMQTDQERNRTGLYIDTETAWVPQHELWDFLIKKYAPHTSYLYYAEEAGLGLYETCTLILTTWWTATTILRQMKKLYGFRTSFLKG